MIGLLRWLLRGPSSLGSVSPWNDVIAERHATATARILLGGAGRARVVGNRRDEAIVAEREQRAATMTARAQAQARQAAERRQIELVWPRRSA